MLANNINSDHNINNINNNLNLSNQSNGNNNYLSSLSKIEEDDNEHLASAYPKPRVHTFSQYDSGKLEPKLNPLSPLKRSQRHNS